MIDSYSINLVSPNGEDTYTLAYAENVSDAFDMYNTLDKNETIRACRCGLTVLPVVDQEEKFTVKMMLLMMKTGISECEMFVIGTARCIPIKDVEELARRVSIGQGR